MAIKYRHLSVDKETYELITKNCAEEFLKHHPEYHGSNITQKFILRQIAEYYLK